MTSLATSSPSHAQLRLSLALALTVAVAPPICALLRLAVEDLVETSGSVAVAMLAPWWVATPLGLVAGHWNMALRTAIAGVLLPFALLLTGCIAWVAAGHAHLDGVSSLDAAWTLCWGVVLSTIVLVVAGILLGFWLVVPLVPWMTVLRRMRLVPSADATSALFFVAGTSALVESAVLALMEHATAWWMRATALMGATALAYALSSWQATIQLVRTYRHADVQSQTPLSQHIPLRLGSDVDDYDYALNISRASAQPQTYRQEPAELVVALIPSGAKIDLATVLWAWLAPMDWRAMKALVTCNTIFLMVCGGILALVKFFG